jgi:hypothetical protein
MRPTWSELFSIKIGRDDHMTKSDMEMGWRWGVDHEKNLFLPGEDLI